MVMQNTVLPGGDLLISNTVALLFYAVIALIIVVAIFAVILVLNTISLRRMKSKYDSFMLSEGMGGITIERLLEECLRESRGIANIYDKLERRTANLENRITFCFQKFGIVRYNPFDEVGGDFSYVVAMLDETNSGIVLNGIYNRSGSYTYAKDIVNGTSVNYKLSYEELMALDIAINGGQSAPHGR